MSAPRVYLDTNITIHFVEQHQQVFPALLQRMFGDQGQALVIGVTSDLVRMEARVRPMRDGDHALLARFDAFFATLRADTMAMDAGVFDLATRLRASHGLKTPDALHLAVALTARCDAFWTNDQRLATVAQGHLPTETFADAAPHSPR